MARRHDTQHDQTPAVTHGTTNPFPALPPSRFDNVECTGEGLWASTRDYPWAGGDPSLGAVVTFAKPTVIACLVVQHVSPSSTPERLRLSIRDPDPNAPPDTWVEAWTTSVLAVPRSYSRSHLCGEVNECLAPGTTRCHIDAVCTNAPKGSYSCTCGPGFEDVSPAEPGTLCHDVNECVADASSACPAGSTCFNEHGGFACSPYVASAIRNGGAGLPTTEGGGGARAPHT